MESSTLKTTQVFKARSMKPLSSNLSNCPDIVTAAVVPEDLVEAELVKPGPVLAEVEEKHEPAVITAEIVERSSKDTDSKARADGIEFLGDVVEHRPEPLRIGFENSTSGLLSEAGIWFLSR